MKIENKIGLAAMGIVFGILFLVNYASAATYLPHQQNTAFDLIVQSNNATACNLTYIQYPDNTQTIFNIPLTKDGTSFYTEIVSGNYSQLGNVCHGIVCTDGTIKENGSVCREITPSGFGNIFVFFFIFIIIITLVFLVGFKMENTWIMTLGSILVLILGFFVIKYGVDIIKDTQTTWAIGLIIWALGIYFLYLSIEEQLKAWK